MRYLVALLLMAAFLAHGEDRCAGTAKRLHQLAESYPDQYDLDNVEDIGVFEYMCQGRETALGDDPVVNRRIKLCKLANELKCLGN